MLYFKLYLIIIIKLPIDFTYQRNQKDPHYR